MNDVDVEGQGDNICVEITFIHELYFTTYIHHGNHRSTQRGSPIHLGFVCLEQESILCTAFLGILSTLADELSLCIIDLVLPFTCCGTFLGI